MSQPVIDMWAPLVPSREIVEHCKKNFPEAMHGYLRVFWKRSPTAAEVEAAIGAMPAGDDVCLELLDRANVRRALITGFDEATSAGGVTFVTNEAVAAIASRHPDRFLPFCGADVFRGAAAVRNVEHWVRDRGFVGLSLRPFMIGLPADDRVYYPFYEKCVELDIPVSVHASANWTTCRPSELGHPRAFDRVACDFPELKLIMSHAGYPWVLEACLLAWKHPNLYLELAAHRPRYFATPGTGWEPLLRFGSSTIKDKVLYGTGAFLLMRTPADLLDELRSLPIPADVLALWTHDNAARLMGLG